MLQRLFSRGQFTAARPKTVGRHLVYAQRRSRFPKSMARNTLCKTEAPRAPSVERKERSMKHADAGTSPFKLVGARPSEGPR
jgi:hypothetical protein